jgi:glycyl-tRNA synthetase beta chain
VGIADKLDSIVGCFSVGLLPTGSADPYALRRQAQGIVEIIFNKKLTLSLEDAIEKSYKLYEPVFLEHLFKKGETGYSDFAGIKRLVLEFLAQRLRNILISQGVRYDVADASLANFSDVLFAHQRAKVIMRNLGSDLLKGIVMTSDRVSRIAKGASREQVIEADLAEDEERSLYDLYMKVNWQVGEAINKGDIQAALAELSRMTKPVDKFFEKILVMHKDERIKLNRLALLKSMGLMYLTVADFPKIVL